jgi:hypothetical protein
LTLAAPPPSITEILAKLPAPEASYLPPDQLAKPSFHAKDGKGSMEVVPAEKPGESPLYKLAITAKPAHMWEAGLSWTTPKGIGPKQDDVLLLTFEARCADSGKDPKGQVRPVLRRTVQPYDNALSETCTFGRTWQRFNLVASPKADLSPDGTLLNFNLGLKVQNIEVRDVRLLNFGQKVGWARFIKLVGASNWRSGRRSVSEQLDPGLLWNMMAYRDLPATAADFSPTGAWQATYAIFVCHGYLLYGNHDLGLLELVRTPLADGTFTLKMTQRIRLDESMLQVTEAEAHCRADALGTPLSWTLKSRFEDSDGKPIPDLAVDETGKPSDLVAGPATGDWCLFEAVQRLTPQTKVPEFSLLEGLSVAKGGQRLSYRGEETYPIADKDQTLRRYEQIGHGVLPTNYWLDASGRLVIAVTHSRAYILDPEAKAKYEQYSADQLARTERIRKRREQQEAK